jgi:hypothetical protein
LQSVETDTYCQALNNQHGLPHFLLCARDYALEHVMQGDVSAHAAFFILQQTAGNQHGLPHLLICRITPWSM